MLLRILLPLLIFLSLPAWGIDRLWLRRRLKHWRRLAFYAPNLILGVLAVFTGLFETYTPGADQWKGTLISLIMLLAIPEIILAVFLVVGKLIDYVHRVAGSVVKWIGLVAALLAFAGILYGSTLGYRHVIVKHYTYTHRRLPAAFDGYRIAQISDLHLGTLHGRKQVLQHIVDSVNAYHPDLIVFTGDLVNYRASEADEFVGVLKRLKAKDGVISIMGNHDYAQYFRWASPADSLADIHRLQQTQRSMGWRLLLNDNHILRRSIAGNKAVDSLAIVGVENDGRPPFPALADLPKAQCGLSPACFKILLSHDPSHWRRSVLPDTDIPLMLAGHTHGMQFKIGNFSPAVWFYPEWGGEYVEGGDRTLYISLGTGEVLIPFRLGAWPEINLITLKK